MLCILIFIEQLLNREISSKNHQNFAKTPEMNNCLLLYSYIYAESIYMAKHLCMKISEKTLKMLANKEIGDLNWIEFRDLKKGAEAFKEIHNGLCSAPKIILIP